MVRALRDAAQYLRVQAGVKYGDRGVAMIEYAVLLGFVVLIGGYFLTADDGLGQAVSDKVTGTADFLNNNGQPAGTGTGSGGGTTTP